MHVNMYLRMRYKLYIIIAASCFLVGAQSDCKRTTNVGYNPVEDDMEDDDNITDCSESVVCPDGTEVIGQGSSCVFDCSAHCLDPTCEPGQMLNDEDSDGCGETCVYVIEQELLCTETGGTWYLAGDSCGHWSCGLPPLCEAEIPGCNCGFGNVFDEFAGCLEDFNCFGVCPEDVWICPDDTEISRTGEDCIFDCTGFCGDLDCPFGVLPDYDGDQCPAGCADSAEHFLCLTTSGFWMELANESFEIHCGELRVIPGREKDNLPLNPIPTCQCPLDHFFESSLGCISDPNCL